MSNTSELPQSDALAEATTDSLSILFSRDPESLNKQDRDAIIRAMREQRIRVEAADAAGAKKPRGASKLPLVGESSKSVDDLGL